MGADLFGEHSECIVVSPPEISGSLANTYLCPSMYLLHGSDLMKQKSLSSDSPECLAVTHSEITQGITSFWGLKGKENLT